jgi:hypothetical protein
MAQASRFTHADLNDDGPAQLRQEPKAALESEWPSDIRQRSRGHGNVTGKANALRDLGRAKAILVKLHGSPCAQGWGPCPCLVAQSIRAIDAAEALESGCEWHAVRNKSFWAKTLEGRH